MFAVLRDLSETAEVRDEIRKMVVEPGSVVRNIPARPRLTLRARDAQFFRDRVQSSASLDGLLALTSAQLKTDAQRNLQSNAAAMLDVLRGWTDDRRLALLTMLSNRTFLVVVTTADLASAHRIFSVMNARGLDLSAADIFKAQVIGGLSDGVSDEYAEKWEAAEEVLRRSEFGDLFLHIRVIFAKERAKRELLKEFPEQVLNQFLPDHGKEFVDEVLVPYADAYRQLQDQNYVAAAGADKVNRWLTRLSQIAGLDAPAFELSDDEKADVRQRLAGELYLSSKVRRYVLLRLDERLANQPGVVYSYKIITVEHVLPQSPKATSRWVSQFSSKEREYWTHRLANLVLLNRSKNAEAQNYDFDVKKQRYFASGNGVATFALTAQVLQESTWTPAGLDARQGRLLDELHNEWLLR